MIALELAWLNAQLYLLRAAEGALTGFYSVRKYLRPAGIALAAGFALGLLVTWI